MKVECLLEKLNAAVSGTERVTGKQLPLPVLSGILIRAFDKTLVLQATNLEVSVEFTIPARVEKKGSALVPGKILRELISHMRSGAKVVLELSGDNLHVSTHDVSMVVKTISDEDFPVFPEPNQSEKPQIKISSGALLDLLGHVAFAGAQNDLKPELASVQFEANNGVIRAVATDGFRLAKKELETKKLEYFKGDFSPVLIPIKNIGEIIRVFESDSSDIEIIIRDHQLIFRSSFAYVVTRLIDGVFPDISQVFPNEIKTEVVALSHDLVEALRVTSVFADKFNRIGIRVIPSDKVCELYSRNQDTGEGTTKLPAALEGEEIDMQFNARYILDVLSVIPDDSVSLRFNQKDRPLVISGNGNPSFVYLVMPLHQ